MGEVTAVRYVHPGREGSEDGTYALTGDDVFVDLLGDLWRQQGWKGPSREEVEAELDSRYDRQ